jgi:hypothetical protein
MNAAYAEEARPEGTLSFDYSDRPFYLYHFGSLAGKSLRFTQTEVQGASTVGMSADLSMMFHGMYNTPLANSNPYVSTSTASNLYIKCYPNNYEVTTRSALKIEDCTEKLAIIARQRFLFDEVVSLGDGYLYFHGTAEGYYNLYLIKKWNIATGAVCDLLSSGPSVSAIAGLGDKVFFSSGKDLSSYDPATGSVTLLHSFPANVSRIAVAGACLLVHDNSYQLTLVDAADGSVKATIGSMEIPYWSVRVPEQGRIYYIAAGNNNHLFYREIDFDAWTFGARGSSDSLSTHILAISSPGTAPS